MTETTNTAVETEVKVDTTTESVATDKVEETKVDLPEKYQGKNLEDVIKMHQEAEKLISKKSPSAPEEYILPDSLKLGTKDILVAKAKELNVTQDQMKAIADVLVEEHKLLNTSAEEAEKSAKEANMNKLNEHFKDTLDVRVKEFKELTTKYAGEELAAELDQLGAYENAAFMKMFDALNNKVLKNTMTATEYMERPKTPAEANKEIAELRMDADFMSRYQNKRVTGHAEAVSKMSELYKIAHS